MTKITCVGEVLVDMLASGAVENSNPPMMSSFQPHAGGAPANVAVAVAKLGGDSELVSMVGEDAFGDYLITMLRHYAVDTTAVMQTDAGKTALAFVSLDADGERSFDFYIDNAAHTWLGKEAFIYVDVAAEQIVHFCSGSLSTPRLREGTDALLTKVSEAGALTCMDINWRPAFWDDAGDAATIIDKVASQVSIIKASKEELDALFGEENTQHCIDHWLERGVKLVLLTDGGEPIVGYTSGGEVRVTPPVVKAKDTTAAGDSFIGGLLYWVATNVSDAAAFGRLASDPQNLEPAISFGAKCGAHTVGQYGAFTALPTSEDV